MVRRWASLPFPPLKASAAGPPLLISERVSAPAPAALATPEHSGGNIRVFSWVYMCSSFRNASSVRVLVNGFDATSLVPGASYFGPSVIAVGQVNGAYDTTSTDVVHPNNNFGTDFGIAELITWTRSLSDSELDAASAYLAQKYSLTPNAPPPPKPPRPPLPAQPTGSQLPAGLDSGVIAWCVMRHQHQRIAFSSESTP